MVKTLALLLYGSLVSLTGVEGHVEHVDPNFSVTSVSILDRLDNQATAKITVISSIEGSGEYSPILRYTFDDNIYETVLPNLKAGEERSVVVIGQLSNQGQDTTDNWNHTVTGEINPNKSETRIDEMFWMDNILQIGLP